MTATTDRRSTSELRERSFANAHLAAASLTGSDLRGSDFTGADLHDADLSRIRSGMSRRWTAVVVGGSLALSIVFGIVAGFAGKLLLAQIVSEDPRRQVIGLFVAASLLVFVVAGIWRGMRFATINVLPVTAALAIASGVIAVLTGTGTGIGALAVLVFLLLAAALVALSVMVRSAAGTGGKALFALVAISGGLAGGAAGGGLAATVIAIAAMLMARRSAKTEAAYPLMTRAIAAVVARGGTKFRDANLAGANLEGARLLACDFRGANLAGTRFERAIVQLCRFDADRVPSAHRA